MDQPADELEPLEPLKISCTDSDCDSDLHCFKFLQAMGKESRGRCRACGADLIDWDRIQARDHSDVGHTFSALKKEFIRHEFFHRRFDEKAVKKAQKLGLDGLKATVRERVVKSLGPEQPFRDGQQTPMIGSPIYYAQHATACCCRTCLEYWHGIAKGKALAPDEIDYCEALIKSYLEDRKDELLPPDEDGQ
jgi:hypothetical protein